MATTAVKERPILFSGEMVKAILDGRKSTTRRVVKPQPPEGYDFHEFVYDQTLSARFENKVDPLGMWTKRCPYGTPGDRLWVREAWAVRETKSQDEFNRAKSLVWYRADSEREGVKWRPSIHMPRWASRITLEITGVRVERLQEISEADAQAEGIRALPLQDSSDPSAWYESAPGENQSRSARIAFGKLWDRINAKRGHSWESNPWVWVIEFRRLTL